MISDQVRYIEVIQTVWITETDRFGTGPDGPSSDKLTSFNTAFIVADLFVVVTVSIFLPSYITIFFFLFSVFFSFWFALFFCFV